MNYDPKQSEAKWQKHWLENDTYRFNPHSGKPIFSIDTPPPTVSGKLHIGHVFSYAQTEILARYFRMTGNEVYYPFGFDNNGLPTEILTERDHGLRGSDCSRTEFQKLCLETSEHYIDQFRELWQSLGFSCDWHEAYSTIDDRCQRISQRSFLELYRKGLIYRKPEPALWCTTCRTAFAQAEIEDIQKEGTFYYIHFTTEPGEKIPIATTRPELLPACVSIFIHPENEIYRHLIGQQAITPIFGQIIPILADEKADPTKGTGIVMCCTFGDTTDIEWWRKHKLPLRIAFTDDGHMTDLALDFAGLTVGEAKQAIATRLIDEKICYDQEIIPAKQRAVNTHGRCGTEVEYLERPQWFIDILNHKDRILEAGRGINWYPRHMQKRFEAWVEGLAWDWCISRERFFGIPIPAWHCDDCGAIILASEDQLPINPLEQKPDSCPDCGGTNTQGDIDVLDTWATSSLTPEINARWGETGDRSDLLRPISMRAQAHDIIRTWAFYTIVKSLYHHDEIPWTNIVISGHALKPTKMKPGRKTKISKSRDNDPAFMPRNILKRHCADTLRYWACSASTGNDVIFEDKAVDEGKKVLTKLWNAGQFAALKLGGRLFPALTECDLRPIDQWILKRLNATLSTYRKAFDAFEFHAARLALYDFFKHDLCDNYLELAKHRFGGSTGEATGSCLCTCFYHTLQMFAPYMPHITEELHHQLSLGDGSIHCTELPQQIPFNRSANAIAAGDLLIKLTEATRAHKTAMGYSLKLPMTSLEIGCCEDQMTLLRLITDELKSFGEIAEIELHLGSIPEAAHDEATGLDLRFRPDPNAIRLAEQLRSIKTKIRELKREHGYTKKETIPMLSIACKDTQLQHQLQNAGESLRRNCRIGELRFIPWTQAMGNEITVLIDTSG